MKRLNEIWVPKSKTERVAVVIGTWVICSIIFGITGENEIVSTVLGVLATAVTVYTLTQGSEELKEQTIIAKEKRREVAAINKLTNQAQKEKRKANQYLISDEFLARKGRKTNVVSCPKCGSTSITAQNKRLSVSRGLVGTVVAGPAGMVVGALTSKKIKKVCLNCGKKWK